MITSSRLLRYQLALVGCVVLALAEAVGLTFYAHVRQSSTKRKYSTEYIRSHEPAGRSFTQYNYIRISTLGGDKAYHGAGGLNNIGQAVGSAQTPSGESHAFVVRDRKVEDLGTLGGHNSTARAINSKGQIVGGAGTLSGTHAFLFENGKMTDMGTLTGFTSSIATSINSSGEIVGRAFTPTQDAYYAWPTKPFYFYKGRMNPLALPTAFIRAQPAAINDHGVVVGWGVDRKQNTLACYWINGKAINLGEQLKKKMSSATAVNNLGQIVGTAGDSERDMRAFVYYNGKIRWLVPLPYHTRNRAAAILDDGTVFGEARVGGEYASAVVWFPYENTPHELIDLLPNSADFFPEFVFAANKRGQALVFGHFATEPDRLILVTPHKKTENAENF